MSRRVALVLAAVALMVLPAGGLLHIRAARAAGGLQAYGADAAGTPVHVVAGSNAFINFSTGAVDNAYPLAVVHIDTTPNGSQATASVADTGPLGATGVAALNDQLRANGAPIPGATQPQYAVAKFPSPTHASQTQGPVVAEADVSENKADSRSAVVAVGSGGPGAIEAPNDPAHTSADAGDAHATRNDSSVVALGHSHLDRATFAGGMLVISDVDVTASVSSDGTTATPSTTVAIGRVTVNGMEVSITDKGVVVNGGSQGGTDSVAATLNAQLNAALASQGLKVFVVAPDVRRDGVAATATVSAVHVKYTQPTVSASVPTQTVEYTLGEARAFAFAVRDETAALLVDSSTGDDFTGVVNPVVEAANFTSTDEAATLPAAVGAPSGAALPTSARPGLLRTQPAVSVSFRRPTWLGVLYLVWLWLVVATAGVIVWARRAGPGEVA